MRANCSTMLLGLLQDVDGNRFHASHGGYERSEISLLLAARNRPNFPRSGERRYVVTANSDIERQVSVSLQSFLQSIYHEM